MPRKKLYGCKIKCKRCGRTFTATSKTKVRRELWDAGWKRERDRFICPGCQTETEKFTKCFSKKKIFSRAQFRRLLNVKAIIFTKYLLDYDGNFYGNFVYEKHREDFELAYLEYAKKLC